MSGGRGWPLSGGVGGLHRVTENKWKELGTGILLEMCSSRGRSESCWYTERKMRNGRDDKRRRISEALLKNETVHVAASKKKWSENTRKEPKKGENEIMKHCFIATVITAGPTNSLVQRERIFIPRKTKTGERTWCFIVQLFIE